MVSCECSMGAMVAYNYLESEEWVLIGVCCNETKFGLRVSTFRFVNVTLIVFVSKTFLVSVDCIAQSTTRVFFSFLFSFYFPSSMCSAVLSCSCVVS